MPSPLCNRILIMNQSDLEVPDGSYVITLSESSLDMDEVTYRNTKKTPKTKRSNSSPKNSEEKKFAKIKRAGIIRGGYVVKPMNGGCRVMQR